MELKTGKKSWCTFLFLFPRTGTFLVFRIMTLGWMTRWLVLHRDQVPLIAYTLGSVGTSSFSLYFSFLF